MSKKPVQKSKPVLARKRARPTKASKEEITERRQHVVRLRMRGLGYRSIAKILGVGHMTVKRDLEAIREYNKQRANVEKEQVVGDGLSLF